MFAQHGQYNTCIYTQLQKYNISSHGYKTREKCPLQKILCTRKKWEDMLIPWKCNSCACECGCVDHAVMRLSMSLWS